MKNRVLKILAVSSIIMVSFGTSCFDSESIVPAMTCIASVIYLSLFAKANERR